MKREQLTKDRIVLYKDKVLCQVIAASKNTASVTIQLLEDDGCYNKFQKLCVNAYELKETFKL